MAKKIKKIQAFRHLTQLIMFFLLPGLYIMAFNELKSIYQSVMKGSFNFLQVIPNSVELISLIIITIILGRFFCGWMCAFGAYNDLIHEISKNVFKVKYRVNEKADSILKYFKYIVLAVIIALSWTMGSSIFSSASPWDAFAQITDLPMVMSSLIVGLILLILITIGAFYIERFFCRYLCPLGALFNIFSKLSIFKINMPKNKCGNCRACTSQCSMGIPLYKENEVIGGECINCMKCVEVCPRKNAKANVLGENVNSTLAGSVALAACLGVYSINGLGVGILKNSGIASAAAIATNNNTKNSQKYKDGTYTGTGTGFRGGTTKVSVTVKNGSITDIETISQQDTPNFYDRAESQIINEIKSAQSTSVDAVSGATFSSNGIINAVQNALTQAGASGNVSTESSSNTVSSNEGDSQQGTSNTSETGNVPRPNSSENSTETNNNSATQGSGYKDGTYTGTGTGFRGGTTAVSVTVSNGKITSINTESSQDTPRFYYRAESVMFDEIISSQSTNVDAVSGATFTSRGIIEAVGNALSKAN